MINDGEDFVATLTLSAKDGATVRADALVVGVCATPRGPRVLAGALPEAVRRRLDASLVALGATGKPDTVHRLVGDGKITAPLVVLTGLGAGTPTLEALRRGAGAAARSLAGTATAAFALPVADAAAVAAVAEGALLGGYAFTRYRSATATPDRQPLKSVVILTTQTRAVDVRAAVHRAQIVATAICAVRDLVNTPPVDLYPAAFADLATQAVAGLPVTVGVLDEKRLQRGGYGGLIGVGKGSARPPRLVRLDYRPASATTHVALVGKGITFDSGGLSIKTASGMETMKDDMAGAATVLHTVVAAARLELPVRVSGWLALAENMPSGTAMRPGDVLTIRGGRTVEVLNTDAEGRLVLADALVAASETEPDVIVDVATLTGAQMIALGSRVSAIMANDDHLRERIHQVSQQVGELFWPMPLPPELRPSLDSAVADLANMGDRYGGMLVAGLFLAEFVGKRAAGDDDERIPWAHLDIAAPAFNTGSAHDYTPVGATGVAVRTMLGLLEDVAARGL